MFINSRLSDSRNKIEVDFVVEARSDMVDALQLAIDLIDENPKRNDVDQRHTLLRLLNAVRGAK